MRKFYLKKQKPNGFYFGDPCGFFFVFCNFGVCIKRAREITGKTGKYEKKRKIFSENNEKRLVFAPEILYNISEVVKRGEK